MLVENTDRHALLSAVPVWVVFIKIEGGGGEGRVLHGSDMENC